MLHHIENLYSGTAGVGTWNTQSSPIITKYDKEAEVFLNITDITGSPTLDITVQSYNSLRNSWHTLGTFSTHTGEGTDHGLIAENIGEKMAISYTVAGSSTPTLTFTVDVGLKNR